MTEATPSGLQAALVAPIACYACIALYGFASLRKAKPAVATA